MGELEIIEGIKNGDQKLFRLIVKEYQEFLLNICYHFVHNEDDAKDLTQDVFLEVYKSIHAFRGDAKFKTWLYRIAVNKSLNFIQRKKIRKLFVDMDSLFRTGKIDTCNNHSFNADKTIHDNERSRYLYQAIDYLSQNQRIAFSLHHLDGMPYSQIADIMNISISSVESLIHRAKSNLQKRLIHFYKKNMD